MKNKTFDPVKACQIIESLIARHQSSRDFSRAIIEDPSDVLRWRYGKSVTKVRAVIAICRLFPEIKPHMLNPIFPDDLEFIFTRGIVE